MRVRFSSARPARSSTSGVVVDVDAERLLDLGLVGRAGRQAAVVEQPVPAVEQRPAPAGGASASPAPRERPPPAPA